MRELAVYSIETVVGLMDFVVFGRYEEGPLQKLTDGFGGIFGTR
jgi:hypothetical protein